jgi:hypothetical protein
MASTGMATKTVGDITPHDDYTHELGPEPNFNESMYFNFFDRAQGLGGFVRLGNRANEGQAEMTIALFLPDGRVAFNFKRAKISSNDAFDAGGMRFDVLVPGEKLRTRYEGTACLLAEPRDMADPRRAFADNPFVKIALDLEHVGVGPMYGSRSNAREQAEDAENQFAKAHYEQHMRVTGDLDVGEECYDLEGFGLRDHSWGPRHWQAIHSYEWLTMNFGDDLGAMFSIIRRQPGEARVHGVIVRGDQIEAVREADIEVDHESNGLYHEGVRVRAKTADGVEHEISGTVRSFIPLRNRRAGMTTHIGEGMTEWRWGERVGYGLSELLRQVE